MLCELSNPSAARADALWQRVVADYRRACLLQRQHRAVESRRVCEQELAASILDWSELVPVDGAAQVERLADMFRDEQARLDDAWLANELLHQRLAEDLVPTLAEQIAAEVRRAVIAHPAAVSLAPASPAPALPAPARPPLSARPPARAAATDIPSIIDALLEQELAGAPA